MRRFVTVSFAICQIGSTKSKKNKLVGQKNAYNFTQIEQSFHNILKHWLTKPIFIEFFGWFVELKSIRSIQRIQIIILKFKLKSIGQGIQVPRNSDPNKLYRTLVEYNTVDGQNL